MSTDAIVLLKNDHKTVEKLFKEFEKAGEDAYREKRRIADSIIEELTVHAYIEEEIFYPAAREAVPETKDHVLESVEEHHVVVWMLPSFHQLHDSSDANGRIGASSRWIALSAVCSARRADAACSSPCEL